MITGFSLDLTRGTRSVLKSGKTSDNGKISQKTNNYISFNGDIFGLADSHLRTRNKCAALSEIEPLAKNCEKVIILDAGDMFNGVHPVYPLDLEIESYLKFKQNVKNAEIVINIGNNDTGETQVDLNKLKHYAKMLSDAGIHMVSANTWDNPENYGVKPYVIINKNNEKIFITGFCLSTSRSRSLGIKHKDPLEVMSKIIKPAIIKEKPDYVVILNHDNLTTSENIMNFAKSIGINVDLILGGHVHQAYYEKGSKIFYPMPYSRSIGEFTIYKDKQGNNITHIDRIINVNSEKISKTFEKELAKAELENGFSENVADSVMALEAHHNQSVPEPSELGTFIADGMRDCTGSEIGIVSRNNIRDDLLYKSSGKITKYDIINTIRKNCRVERVIINADILKQIFENSLKNQNSAYAHGNFVDYSSNLKVVRRLINDKGQDKVVQIYLIHDNYEEPLLDERTGKAISPERKIICAVDSEIGSGQKGYTMLKSCLRKSDVNDYNIVGLFENSLKKLALKANLQKPYQKAQMQTVN